MRMHEAKLHQKDAMLQAFEGQLAQLRRRLAVAAPPAAPPAGEDRTTEDRTEEDTVAELAALSAHTFDYLRKASPERLADTMVAVAKIRVEIAKKAAKDAEEQLLNGAAALMRPGRLRPDGYQIGDLCSAAARGDQKQILVLLHAGLNPNAAVEVACSWPPLLFAAQHGHASVVRALLGKAADVFARDKFRETAAMQAEYWGHTEAACILRQHERSAIEDGRVQEPESPAVDVVEIVEADRAWVPQWDSSQSITLVASAPECSADGSSVGDMLPLMCEESLAGRWLKLGCARRGEGAVPEDLDPARVVRSCCYSVSCDCAVRKRSEIQITGAVDWSNPRSVFGALTAPKLRAALVASIQQMILRQGVRFVEVLLVNGDAVTDMEQSQMPGIICEAIRDLESKGLTAGRNIRLIGSVRAEGGKFDEEDVVVFIRRIDYPELFRRCVGDHVVQMLVPTGGGLVNLSEHPETNVDVAIQVNLSRALGWWFSQSVCQAAGAITSLNLSGCELYDDGMAPLLEGFVNLEMAHLDISSCGLGLDTTERLASIFRSTLNSSLRSLNAGKNPGLVGAVDDSGRADMFTEADQHLSAFRGLCDVLKTTAVVELDLTRVGLGHCGATVVADFIRNSKAEVKSVVLDGNLLSGSAVRVQTGEDMRAQVRGVSLDGNMAGFKQLCSAISVSHMHKLSMQSCYLSGEAMVFLARAIRSMVAVGVCTLESLTLSTNPICGVMRTRGNAIVDSRHKPDGDLIGWTAICGALMGSHLTELAVADVGIGPAGASFLAEIIPSIGVAAGEWLREAGYSAIVGQFDITTNDGFLPTLTSLDISGNEAIQDKGASAVLAAVAGVGITHLDISGCGWGIPTVHKLCALLEEESTARLKDTLTTLSLANNAIGYPTSVTLVTGAKHVPIPELQPGHYVHTLGRWAELIRWVDPAEPIHERWCELQSIEKRPNKVDSQHEANIKMAVASRDDLIEDYDHIRLLAESISSSNIRSIDLSSCGLNALGINVFVTNIDWKGIEWASFHGNSMSEQLSRRSGADALIGVLKKHTHLQTLLGWDRTVRRLKHGQLGHPAGGGLGHAR